MKASACRRCFETSGSEAVKASACRRCFETSGSEAVKASACRLCFETSGSEAVKASACRRCFETSGKDAVKASGCRGCFETSGGSPSTTGSHLGRPESLASRGEKHKSGIQDGRIRTQQELGRKRHTSEECHKGWQRTKQHVSTKKPAVDTTRLAQTTVHGDQRKRDNLKCHNRSTGNLYSFISTN